LRLAIWLRPLQPGIAQQKGRLGEAGGPGFEGLIGR
jgi:hypothetical protein